MYEVKLDGAIGNVLEATIDAAAEGTKITMEPDYGGTETIDEAYEGGVLLGDRTYQYPSKGYVIDRRPNTDMAFARNIDGDDEQKAAFNRAHYFDKNRSILDQQYSAGASFTYFAGSTGNMSVGQETLATAVSFPTLIASKGIASLMNYTAEKTGVGDWNLNTRYMETWGGAINPDDEGVTMDAKYLTESGGFGGVAPQTTIASFVNNDEPPSTDLVLNAPPPSGTNRFGAGRYLLRTSDASHNNLGIGPYTALSQDLRTGDTEPLYTTLTIKESLDTDQIAAVWGVTDAFHVPYNNDVAQSVHDVRVTIDSASPNHATGYVNGLACISGVRRSNRVRITIDPDHPTPDTNGVQTLTIEIREVLDGFNQVGNPPTANYAPGFLIQDKDAGSTTLTGLGQTLVRIGAYDTGLGRSSQSIPVIGALDEHTLVLSAGSTQGQRGIPGFSEALATYGTVQLTRDASNTVTIVGSTGFALDLLYRMTDLTISSSADPSLNHTGAVVRTSGGDYTYTAVGAVVSTPVEADTVLGATRNQIMLYRGVEVIAVTRPDESSFNFGTYVGLEYNTIPFATGDTVESPGHYSTFLKGTLSNMSTAVPASNSGLTHVNLGVEGPGAAGNYTGVIFQNGNDTSYYAGNGGFVYPPNAIRFNGCYQSLITAEGSSWPGYNFFQAAMLTSGDIDHPHLYSGFNFLLAGLADGVNYEFSVDQGNSTVSMSMGSVLFSHSLNGFALVGGPTYFGNQRLTGLADGVVNDDAATFGQISQLEAGVTQDVPISPTVTLRFVKGIFTGTV